MHKKDQSGSILIIVVGLLLLTAIIGSYLYLNNKQDTESAMPTTPLPVDNTNQKQADPVINFGVINNPTTPKPITRDDPCDEPTSYGAGANLRVGQYDVGGKTVVVCKSYLTDNDTCFNLSDKAENNPMPCENTENGPYNLVFGYQKTSDGKYTAVYLTDEADTNWVSFGVRPKSSVPDLASRKIEGTNYYLSKPTDPCPTGSVCGVTDQDTRYYELDEQNLLVMNYYTEQMLRARGG